MCGLCLVCIVAECPRCMAGLGARGEESTGSVLTSAVSAVYTCTLCALYMLHPSSVTVECLRLLLCCHLACRQASQLDNYVNRADSSVCTTVCADFLHRTDGRNEAAGGSPGSTGRAASGRGERPQPDGGVLPHRQHVPNHGLPRTRPLHSSPAHCTSTFGATWLGAQILLGCTTMYAQCACQPLGCDAPAQPCMRKAPSNNVTWLSTRLHRHAHHSACAGGHWYHLAVKRMDRQTHAAHLL